MDLPRMAAVSMAAALSTASGGAPADAADGQLQRGCYTLVHDANHMRRNRGQIVRRVTLAIAPLRPAQLATPHADIVGNADLRIRVKGRTTVFASYGVCREKKGAYDCFGHDLANEHKICAESRPGVHDCRMPMRADRFHVEKRPDGVLVRIPVALQLDAGDTGPYLHLLAADRQNSEFILSPTRICR